MRTIKLLLAMTPFALTGMLLAGPASAATPPPILNAITPFSFPQFKSTSGMPALPTPAVELDDFGLPSTPMALDDSSQTDTTTTSLTTLPAGWTMPTPGQQLRAYLLGDYGITPLPPAGNNNFLDLEAGGITGVDTLTGWVAPFYASTSASEEDLTVDDDIQNDIVHIPPTGTPVKTILYGSFVFGPTSAAWTTESTGTPTPPTATTNAPPSGTDNFYGDSYRTIPATSRLVEDSTDGGVSANYAHWVPYITTPGNYTVYAYFPTQNLTATDPEAHVDDARYTIYIKQANQALETYQVDVNQQNGGTWVPIGGPYNFPVTTSQFVGGGTTSPTTTLTGPTLSTVTSGQSFVDIRVDDTTNDTLPTTVGGDPVPTVVVADAVQLRPQVGHSFGTPVAVNCTPPILANYTFTGGSAPQAPPLTGETGTVGDYSEIALGYGGGSPAGDGFTGGLPLSYVADGISGTGTAESASPTTPQYYAGNFGYEAMAGTLTGLPVTPSTAPTAPTTWVLAGDTQPIDQAVYFTRTEQVNIDPDTPAETVQEGFLYCANGSTGDIIWRFPNSTPLAIGDLNATQFTEPTGTWAASTADIGSSYNGESYQTTPAISGTAPSATAVWTVPSSFTLGRYYVYAYFPSQGNGENHCSDVHYTINNGSAATPLAFNCYVNQQVGGDWVQLSSVTGTTSTNIFTLTPGTANVQLGNDTTASIAATPPPVVCADAVEFVPATTMGPSDSTRQS